MSPSSREIHGSRPAPLKIHKDSHLIHKASSSSSSSSTTTNASSQQQQRHRPVIIYTHSPKVIHTQAHDFMALVQKLTGLSRSTEDDSLSTLPPAPPAANASRLHKDNNRAAVSASDDSSSSSENSSLGGDVHVTCSSLTSAGAISPMAFEPLLPPNPFFSEIPMFTPTSEDFICSSMPFYRYPDSSVLSPSIPNMGSAISPPYTDAMNHEY
ncbi:VQ motif [Musa troglodytarum]|uniref:VQ motif n=1 Tax=Musa troglodytarum TaxID=320322 RepID=A0A9E7J964_9LILI|nr:VQ motif [Musa troglodytarum]